MNNALDPSKNPHFTDPDPAKGKASASSDGQGPSKKSRKRWKRWLGGLGIFLLLLVALLAAAPYLLYKNQKSLVQQALQKVNQNLEGVITLEDSYISPFKQFPYVSIDLKGLRFYTTRDTTEKPAYEVKDCYLGFNILGLLQGNYEVKTIRLENGHLDLIQHPDGTLNILKAKNIVNDSSAAQEEAFAFKLKKLKLKDFDLLYYQESDSLLFESYMKEAQASFNLQDEKISASLNGNMIWNLVQKGDTSFFREKQVGLQLEVDYLQDSGLVRLHDSELVLDAGNFGLDGEISTEGDMPISLTMQGTKPDFNLLLSFATPELRESFRQFDNSGTVYFDASINGALAVGKKYALTANFGCKNGYFKNRNTAESLQELAFTGKFSNGLDSTWASAELQLENIYAKPGTGIFTGSIAIKNFLDPQIAVKLHSDLNLQFLEKFLGIEALQGIQGQVLLDMNFNELINFQQPENTLVQLKKGIDSELRVKQFSFQIPGMAYPVRNLNLHAQMANGALEIDTLHCQLGKSDIAFSASLNDLPALFHRQQRDLVLKFKTSAQKIYLNELMGPGESAWHKEEVKNLSLTGHFETTVDKVLSGLQATGIPKGEFFIDDFYAGFKNYPHALHDFHADLLITDSVLALKDFSGEIDETDFHFTGACYGYKLWLQPNEKRNGHSRCEVDLKSNILKFENLFSYGGENFVPADYRHEEIKDLELHVNADLAFRGAFQSLLLDLQNFSGKMKVHPLKLEKFKGLLEWKEDKMTLTGFSGRMGRSNLQAEAQWYLGADTARKKELNFVKLQSEFLDIDALLNYTPPATDQPVAHAEAFNIFQWTFPYLRLEADLKKVNHHQYWLKNLRTAIRVHPNHFLYIDTFSMEMAGGQYAVQGYLNGSDPQKIYFKSSMDLSNVDLDRTLFKFDNFGQEYELNKNLHGNLSGRIQSIFRVHPDLVPILEESEAQLDVVISNGTLVDFSPMQALSGYFKDKNLKMVRFDTLRNSLQLRQGQLIIPVMNINSSLGFIEIGGKQGLDMKMDYLLRIPLKMVTQVGFRALFGGRKKEEVDPLQEDAIVYRDNDKRVSFVNVRITGTPDQYKISLGKK
jgi:hypothetical protein